MRVSVVVPCHNSSSHLISSVASAMAQTPQPLEILCVDDASANDTWEMIRSLVSRFPKTVKGLRHEVNQGSAAARNTAIREARGDWIAFLDDDDLWLPDRLERQARYLEEHPETEFLHGAAWWEKAGEPGSRRLMHRGIPIPVGDCLVPLFHRNFIVVATVLASRMRIAECSFFSPQFRVAQDYDLWLRMARAGCRFDFLDQPIAVYRRDGGNVTNDAIRMSRGCLAVLENLLATDPGVERIIGERGVCARLLSERLFLIRRLVKAKDYAGAAVEWEKAWAMGSREPGMRILKFCNALFGRLSGGFSSRSIKRQIRHYRRISLSLGGQVRQLGSKSALGVPNSAERKA